MNKISLVGIFATVFFISCVLGATLTRTLLPCVMAVKTRGKSKLLLQFRNGTAINSYSWGEFSKGQSKQLACQLTYIGKIPVEVLWNITNFPLGWKLKIQVELDSKQKWWSEDSVISFVSQKTLLIRIFLKEVRGTPGQSEFFTLNFITFSEKK